jgi:hypothetical protein
MPIPRRCRLAFAFLAVAGFWNAGHSQQPQAAPTPSKTPGFLKVDSVYILDGNENDLVKVLELSPSGWIRVQTKGGESWVNTENLTTITPVSKEAADRTAQKEKADFILAGAEAISLAVDDYASKQNLPMDAPVKWEDIRKYIKPDAPAYDCGGKDVTGRPYLIGPKIEDHVKISADTIKELNPAVGDPAAFWGRFTP